MGPGFESLKVHHGPLVKWLRQRPLTPLTSVRIRYGSPFFLLTAPAVGAIISLLLEAKRLLTYIDGLNPIHIVGIDCDEGPPVPIPNTEVKLICADNTWRATAREDR